MSSQNQSQANHINLLNIIILCQLPDNLCDFEKNGGNSRDFVIDFQQHKIIIIKSSYFHRSSIIIKNGNYTTLKQQMVFFGGIAWIHLKTLMNVWNVANMKFSWRPILVLCFEVKKWAKSENQYI